MKSLIMVVAGILGFWELLLLFGFMVLLIIPAIIRKARARNNQMTEKLDQLERLERMYRDGSISEREFQRQKRKIMK